MTMMALKMLLTHFPRSIEAFDTDGDGVGNNADPDDDNDGVEDGSDAFPLDAAELVDTDGDGVGNNADSDDDNDGVTDTWMLSRWMLRSR